MAKISVGHFEGDNGLIYLPLGYVPGFVMLVDYTTNPVIYCWFERMEDDEATGSQEGMILAGGSSNWTKSADAGGIAAYDSGSQLPVIGIWRAAQTTLLDKQGNAIAAFTIRTATAHGTYCIGTTSGVDMDGNKVDRDQVFECVAGAAGTTGATEPDWPVEIGQNSALDGSTIIWQKVGNVALLRGGYEGIRIAATLLPDGREGYYLAIQADKSEDLGDVVSWAGGVYGA